MLIGHQTQWKYLKSLAELGKAPHAFLFCGERQIGKKRAAVEFAKLIFGSESKQSIEKGIYPDLTFVEPTLHPAKQSEGQIQISQIRELNSYFNLGSLAAPLKIAIIDEAHLMTREAQSSFLKLLEEPRSEALFILITPFPKMLLPTILSRVQTVKFYRVANLEIKNYLQNDALSEKTVEEIVEFSEGKPGRAINFLSNPQKLKRERDRVEEIIKVTKADLAFRFRYVKNLTENSQDLGEILEFWLRYFRKILLTKIKGNQDFNRYSLTKIKKIISLIQNINFLISNTNVNPRLALELLMLEF